MICRFDITFAFATPKSSCRQALMLPGGWRRMHGQSRPVQTQAGPSCKTALMVVATPTVVRFLGFVERESFPMQDEPEGRPCFQHKMSLKD